MALSFDFNAALARAPIWAQGPAMRAAGLVTALVSGRDSRSQTGRAAITAFSIRVASAGLLYLSQIAMARWMGTHEYGIYVFVWTWVLVLGGLSPAGLGLGMLRLLPEAIERMAFASARGILFYGRLFALASSTTIAALACLVIWLAGDLIANHYVAPLYLALVCIPMYALGDMLDGIGRSRGWMLEGLVAPYILRPLILLLSIAAAHEIGFATTASTAVIAAIVATWLSGLIQLVLIERRLNAEIPAGPREADIAHWMSVSLPLLAIGGCELLLQYTDVIIISKFLSPSDVGIYFAAAKTMALMLFVHYAVGSAAAKRFASLAARGDRDELTVAVRDAVTWTFWPSLGAAGAILLLGQPLLWLFGPEFVDGFTVMTILVFGYLMRAATGPSDFLLNMSGHQGGCALVYAVAALTNLVLNLVLVPTYGLHGAALATAISLSLAAILHCRLVYTRLGFKMWIWS